jgi:hypothetical protein
MTAEVENLLAALDGMNWPECINAAELIRSQAEEISRLQTDYAALMNKYIQPCCQQWNTCERQCIPLVKHLREQLAAAEDRRNKAELYADEQTHQRMQADAKIATAARQEPVQATCFHTIKKGETDDQGYKLFPGRYALYPDTMKLYAAPVPAAHPYGTLRSLDDRRVPHPDLQEVFKYYDNIIKDAPYDDLEWDFVMTAAEYRLLRVAAMIGAEHPNTTPVPAGDAGSVSARCCGHEWYQGACVHCNLPVHEYKRPK